MPLLPAIWIWVCAYLNCAGWVLSALHQLNAGGYAVTLALGLVSLLVWRRKTSSPWFPQIHRQKYRHRFRRPFPLAFLVLAMLAILGGALYAPTNYDALAYRIPRILHWLDAGQWQWIHTDFNRLNTRGCGIEWVSAPFIALLKTERLLFLINIISFLLLPGLAFSLFTRLGVRRRTAWYWMWLMPTGYGFLLQAGSIGNDLFGAVFVMAAIDFALRARQENCLGSLWVSILAAGLMTASKSFNLVLLLPWTIALISPALRLLLQRPVASVFIGVAAALASLLPTALLNTHYCGDWTGLAADPVGFGVGPPVLYLITNTILLIIHNFAPPIFPFSNAWHQLVQQLMPTATSIRLHQYFEPEGAEFRIRELQMEEMAGLGLGVSFLLLCVLIRRICGAAGAPFPSWVGLKNYKNLVPLGVLAALTVILVQSGLSVPARYLLPFYILLLTPLLRGAAPMELIKKRWWRRTAYGGFFLAALVLALNPARPLWPSKWVLDKLGAHDSSNPLVQRAGTVYSVYRERGAALQPILDILPADAHPLGMVTSDDPETSLWKPFGARRILHICQKDGPEEIRDRGIKYALINAFILNQNNISLEAWLARYHAEVVQRMSLTLRATRGPTDWYLVRLRDE